MTRKFKTVDYEATLEPTVSLREALPAQHPARFVVDVVAELDLTCIYVRDGLRGGEAYAPAILLDLLFYGCVTGVFSSCKIEKSTYESLPFRFVAGGLHPDHDTLANFRKTFRGEIKELFVQVPLLAQTAGYLTLGDISMDGLTASKTRQTGVQSRCGQLNVPNRRHWTGRHGPTRPANRKTGRAGGLSWRHNGHTYRRPRSLRQTARPEMLSNPQPVRR